MGWKICVQLMFERCHQCIKIKPIKPHPNAIFITWLYIALSPLKNETADQTKHQTPSIDAKGFQV